MPQRLQALNNWLKHDLALPVDALTPASGDASFRRYFRAQCGEQSYIVMDAPPEKEECRPYIEIARAFHQLGLNVPEIIQADLQQGFLLLTDLGTRLYLAELNSDTVDRLYGDALGALITLQACGPGACELPPYNRTLLLNEMELFREWLLQRHLGVEPDASQQQVLDEVFALLAESALEQPVVCVHRDYHSRNLMVTGRHNPGILDFQDAVMGPVTYDLVSLLRDCYIRWPRQQVQEWVYGYHDLALQSGILREANERRFMRWFDLMGMQRHLKATGIFARLNHRDGKPGYLGDIPRTLGYVVEVCEQYSELESFHALLQTEVLPRI